MTTTRPRLRHTRKSEVVCTQPRPEAAGRELLPATGSVRTRFDVIGSRDPHRPTLPGVFVRPGREGVQATERAVSSSNHDLRAPPPKLASGRFRTPLPGVLVAIAFSLSMAISFEVLRNVDCMVADTKAMQAKGEQMARLITRKRRRNAAPRPPSRQEPVNGPPSANEELSTMSCQALLEQGSRERRRGCFGRDDLVLLVRHVDH